MDFDRLFLFISKDQNWPKKAAIAAVLILSQIGTIAVIGWAAEIAKRAADGEVETLPEWDELGNFFLAGLKLIGVSLIWFLPPALLVLCQSTVMIASLQRGETNTLVTVLTASSVIVYLLIFIYLIAGGLIFSPLYVFAAEGKEFKQLLKPGPAWQLVRANFGGYILAILVSSLFNLVLGFAGILVCFVGTFFGTALGLVFLGILTGMATAQARENINQHAADLPMEG